MAGRVLAGGGSSRRDGSPCLQIKCGSPRHLKGHGGDSPMVEIDDVNSGVGELRRGVEANEIHGCLYVVTVAYHRVAYHQNSGPPLPTSDETHALRASLLRRCTGKRPLWRKKPP
eukprot:symbB.v1.2.004499.t1/scaffold250.1/size251770/10